MFLYGFLISRCPFCEPSAIKKDSEKLSCCFGSRGLFLSGLDFFSFCVKLCEFSGFVTYCDLSVRVFMNPDPCFDVMMSVAIGWDLQSAVFLANGVVSRDDPFLLYAEDVFIIPCITSPSPDGLIANILL